MYIPITGSRFRPICGISHLEGIKWVRVSKAYFVHEYGLSGTGLRKILGFEG